MNPQTPFTRTDLEAAVRNELKELIQLSDADLAWIVEATVWQIGHALRNHPVVDLDYIGTFSRAQMPDGAVYRFQLGQEDAA